MERIYSSPDSRGGHFSRVKDLERSQQWTSLASDIDDLERAKMREHGNTSASRNHVLHRRSMPEPQKTSLIYVDVDTDNYGTSGSLKNKSITDHYFLPIGSGSIDESVDSWSWGQEREYSPDKKYFGNNNYQNYDYNRPGESWERNNRRNNYHKDSKRTGGDEIDGVTSRDEGISLERVSAGKEKPFWNSGRFDEEETAYRGSREKLHEIFRRNRDLRREFFATVPKSASESCQTRVNESPEFKDRSINGRGDIRQETAGSGYGSVETLTSQSNNSEISGIQNRRTENPSRGSENCSRGSELTPENGVKIGQEMIILDNNRNPKSFTAVNHTVNLSEFSLPVSDKTEIRYQSLPRIQKNESTCLELSSRLSNPSESLESPGFEGGMSPPPLPSSDPPSSRYAHQLLISGDSLTGSRPPSIAANPPDPPERRVLETRKYGTPGVLQRDISSPEGYRAESEGLRMLNRFEACIENRKLSPLLIPASDKSGNSKNVPGVGSGLSKKDYKSMPDLGHVGIAGNPRKGIISRIAVNGSTLDLDIAGRNYSREKLNRYLNNGDESETGNAFRNLDFTQVRPKLNYVEEPREIHATRVDLWEKSKLSNRRRRVPPPLDLSGVSEALREETLRYERKILRDYSEESTPLQGELLKCKMTVLDGSIKRGSSDRPRLNAALETATNLLDLSRNLSRPVVPERAVSGLEKKPENRGEERGENRSPGGPARFRSSVVVWCDGNSKDNKHTLGEKRPEPALVRRSTLDHRKSTGSLVPATGNVFPSVYAPIPYKSPRRYVEGEVTIHYRSPVRTEAKEVLSEAELARRSAENMRRVYQEERRRKYLQELHDIDSRRHTDNFTPSQKSPIPLNRYDDFVDDLSHRSRSQEQTPEPRLVAKALYNFVGQSSRELTFRRGDIIFVRRQVDKNWYEGEHNAMIGLFPFNYVEILPYDGIRTTTTPKKPYEGQARAKFNFVAQTTHELSLVKGDLVVLTRRVDENWYEGRIGNRKGIFPISYVEVLVEPGIRPETPAQNKPVAAPAAHSLLSNGSAGGKLSMGPHHYTPSIPTNTNAAQPNYNSLPRMGGSKLHVAPVNETLHIDTHSEPLRYRSLYNYRPQNDDELELKEGDTVYVMEKCDDGWFVGSSQRTGCFGTFPGNYVERL